MQILHTIRNYYLGLYYWQAENSVAKTKKPGQPDTVSAFTGVGCLIVMIHISIIIFSIGSINNGGVLRYLFGGLNNIHLFSTYKGDVSVFGLLFLLFIPLIGYLLLRFRMPYEAIRPRLASTPYFLDMSKRRFFEWMLYPILGLLIICIAMHIVF